MPEIKHQFTGGKMNKDLDERLIPNGEYRDAVNIQVMTSEESAVGTAQNILGNSLIAGQDFIPATAKCVGSISDEKNDKLYYFVVDSEELIVNGDFDDSASSWTLQSPWNYSDQKVTAANAAKFKKILQDIPTGIVNAGDFFEINFTISDYVEGKLKVNCYNENGGGFTVDPIYLENKKYTIRRQVVGNMVSDSSLYSTFRIQSYENDTDFTGSIDNISVTKSTSYIVEYDTKLNVITPVIVDLTNTVLSFNPDRLITGINIIDNMLFWTDNYSEPKKINITRSIKGTDKSGTSATNLLNESRGINVSSNKLLEEKHITVIKKSPTNAPTIELISERSNQDKIHTGVMRITGDPGGISTSGNNFQNASSFWIGENYSYNHFYDFSTLKVGSTFYTNIETDLAGDSGFILDWNVGDTLLLKEFGGNNYDEPPAIPITDYTVKCIIKQYNWNRFTDAVNEVAVNGSFILPSANASEPANWSLSSAATYNPGTPSQAPLIELVDSSWNDKISTTPLIDFVEDGVYKITIVISGYVDGQMKPYIVGNDTYSYYNAGDNIPYWQPAGEWITSGGTHEFTLTLDSQSNQGSTTVNPGNPADYSYFADKFFLRTTPLGGLSSNNAFTGNIESISIEQQDASNARVGLEILSINGVPPTVSSPQTELRFAVDRLDEAEKLFEFKFPRFAYRYQYEDKEYSTFSPFTEIAFLPGSFDYHPKKGYNLGMTNSINEIKISNFIPPNLPDDIVAVDILYKDEVSPIVYVLDTIKNNHDSGNIWDNNEYVVKSELINRVLPSNQILRPWDAVPKKALAQEVTGNRIVYANYTQGFDLVSNLSTKKEYYPDFNFNIVGVNSGLKPVKSIKSLREYQLGVVFTDEYGRETPVLSSLSGFEKLNKTEAAKQNKIQVSFGNTKFPKNMKYFKLYIKETSGEYYNMAMDRWWDAGDEHAWLSFPSSDRNKINDDTFLILKKGVESSTLVPSAARFKVLAIQNEAPDFIKANKILIEEKTHVFDSVNNIFGDTVDKAPVVGRDFFEMNYEPFHLSSGSDLHNIEEGVLYVEFTLNKSSFTKRYRISELTTNYDGSNSGEAVYHVRLQEPLGDDVNVICNDPQTGLNSSLIVDQSTIRIYKYTIENTNEFDGRFFVKVVNDTVFNTNIGYESSQKVKYRTSRSKKMYYMASDNGTLHSNLLTGQTAGEYGTINTSTGLGFGQFASFFRNYNRAAGDQGSNGNDVSQYMFGNPSSEGGSQTNSKLVDELKSVTAYAALGTYNGTQIVMDWEPQNTNNSNSFGSWKVADYAGERAAQRYGEFNAKSEQETGSVWFIDAGPYAGKRTTNSNLEWNSSGELDSTSTGVETGISSIGGADASIVFAMGGIYHPDIADSTSPLTKFFDIGSSPDTENIYYDQQDIRALVNKIQPAVRFRFKEDPTQSVYVISPGTSHRQLARWTSNSLFASTAAPRRAAHLTPNFTKGFKAKVKNIATDDGTFAWDPTGGNSPGPISNGLKLSVARSNSAPTFTGTNLKVAVDNIHGLTCENNGSIHTLAVGMILTSYNNGANQLGNAVGSEYLIIKEIDHPTASADYFVLSFAGYTVPLLIQEAGNLTSTTDFSPHTIFGDSVTGGAAVDIPAAGENMVFQQPAMNGYSQYSVNRININDANNEGWSLDNPGLMAVGYTVEFLEAVEEEESDLPDNPAIWETEPGESTDLDIYYEASGYNPLELTEDTKYLAIPIGSLVESVETPAATLVNMIATSVSKTSLPGTLETGQSGAGKWRLSLATEDTQDQPLVGGSYIQVGSHLKITKPDGSVITVKVTGWDASGQNFTSYPARTPYIYIDEVLHGPNTKYTLNWHNCYSFGNGVESNRIRDGFNLPFITSGVKASTTLDEQPNEEYRKYSLVYSGIYNGSVGINNLNQFIAAEKITKDINPTYGSIQKLKAGWGQSGDLITLCEDRILKIIADKDALFNADGNPQLLSTNAVLGQAIPYSGEFGISKNPESFASEAYRAYFTDRVRGSVMRLSVDGLTSVSNAGMKDWFKDNLQPDTKIIGSYDDRNDEYNITLPVVTEAIPGLNSVTVSFREDVKGWVSFKSFIAENGVSCANDYHTFANGRLWKHHDETVDRNTFYNQFHSSSVNVVMNEQPSSIKSYHTLNYEGSQSRVEVNFQDKEYYNLHPKEGWYVDSIFTNKERGAINEFIEKEGKWFNYIKGVDFNVTSETDFGAFNVQGIGMLLEVNSLELRFDNDVNVSLQIGDVIYYQTPSANGGFNTIDSSGITKYGDVTEVANKTIKVNPTGSTPAVGDYIMFVKNDVVNKSSLSGYFADVKLENNSKIKAEIFSVSSEVSESSK